MSVLDKLTREIPKLDLTNWTSSKPIDLNETFMTLNIGLTWHIQMFKQRLEDKAISGPNPYRLFLRTND